MSNDDGQAIPPAAAEPKGIVHAALGLRAYGGSREALLRAAFELVDTTPGLRVDRRSFVWRCASAGPPAFDYLTAAVGLTSHLPIDQLPAVARALQERVTGGPEGPGGPGLFLVDLLWAWDPQGKPDAPPVPLTTPLANLPGAPLAGVPGAHPPPPPPPGRSIVNPEIATRASACGPLAEVAPDAQDPVTGRYLSEHLYTVPEPYIELPRPFTPSFATEARPTDHGLVLTTSALDRADLLAAVAEAFGGAADDVLPELAVPVATGLPDEASADVRALFWLRAVHYVMHTNGLRLRRAVVLADEPGAVHGLLLGSAAAGPPKLGTPETVTVRIDEASRRMTAEAIVSLR